MSAKPPKKPGTPHGAGTAGGSTSVTIDNLHLHSNDLDALRRLSQQDPELAKEVVKQRENFDRRDHASQRFGITAAALLVLSLIAACTFALYSLGIVLSLLLIFLILAVALMIRVLVTGEWSETSWVGGMIKGIIGLTGGRPKDGND